MPAADASQWVEVTAPKVPWISGRVVNMVSGSLSDYSFQGRTGEHHNPPHDGIVTGIFSHGDACQGGIRRTAGQAAGIAGGDGVGLTGSLRGG